MDELSYDFFEDLTSRDIIAAVVRESFLERLYQRTRKECTGCQALYYFPQYEDELESNSNFHNKVHICKGKGVYWTFEKFADEVWDDMMDNFRSDFENQYNSIMAEFPNIECLDERMKFCCFQPWLVPYLTTCDYFN